MHDNVAVSYQHSETGPRVISDARHAAKNRLLSFIGMQTKVVTGLLTGCNTLRRRFYIMGVIDSPLCWRCGTEEETSTRILYE